MGQGEAGLFVIATLKDFTNPIDIGVHKVHSLFGFLHPYCMMSENSDNVIGRERVHF